MPVCNKTPTALELGRALRAQRRARWGWLAKRYGVKRGGHTWLRHGGKLTKHDLSLRFGAPPKDPGVSSFNQLKGKSTFSTAFLNEGSEWKARHAFLESFAQEMKAHDQRQDFFKVLGFPEAMGHGINRQGVEDNAIKKVAFCYRFHQDSGLWQEVSAHPRRTDKPADREWSW